MKDLQVKVGSIMLQVRDYEQGGEAIICLHFSGANLMMWQGIVPYFKDRYRLILVDLRGHGKSDKPRSSYHIDEMAGDVLGMMQELRIEKAHVIGSSLGAEVGLSLAANYPERVISLVCDGASNSEYGPYGVWEGTEAAFEEDVAKQISKVGQRADVAYGRWTNCWRQGKSFWKDMDGGTRRRGDECVRCLSDRGWAVQAWLSDLGAASLSRALFQVSIRGLLQEGNMPGVDGAGRRGTAGREDQASDAGVIKIGG